ncbi:hypothetical protein HDU67_001156 [Dinochytrium kinnereticum]|nr:hypothetical protein HDU67_001156 [Dinochytrium kinnereticum]
MGMDELFLTNPGLSNQQQQHQQQQQQQQLAPPQPPSPAQPTSPYTTHASVDWVGGGGASATTSSLALQATATGAAAAAAVAATQMQQRVYHHHHFHHFSSTAAAGAAGTGAGGHPYQVAVGGTGAGVERVAGVGHVPVGKNEIGVRVGDRVVVVSEVNGAWCFGQNLTTRLFGVFPAACVGGAPVVTGGEDGVVAGSGGGPSPSTLGAYR